MGINSFLNFGLVLFSLLLGLLFVQFQPLAKYYSVGVVLFGVGMVALKRNSDHSALLWAGYLVGAEVLLRMTGGFFAWEAGKYSVCAILLFGLAVEKTSKRYPFPILLYGLLLIPSIAVVDFPDFFRFRSDVSFNLSGPLTLVIASGYLYQRNLTLDQIISILRMMVLPLISVLIYLTLVTPELSDIEYGTQSNFTASGGFGPNQVATAMGLGLLGVGFAVYFGRTISGLLWVDIALMAMFLIRGFATFSRGGIIGGLSALLVLVVLGAVLSKRIIPWGRVLLYASGGVLVSVLSWNYVNEVSQNRLQYRYQGIDYRTGLTKDITSNRLFILEREIQLFLDNPVFGIGPGMIRETALRGDFIANTHSEFSRTLAEHGLFGVAALCIMIVFPIVVITKRPKEFWPISFAFLFLAFFTMFHSAMRLAMPGFLYGLIFFLPSVSPRPKA